MTNLVATELRNSGFSVRLFGEAIEVSLANRKVSQMEIQVALMKNFDEIEFSFQSTSKGGLVIV